MTAKVYRCIGRTPYVSAGDPSLTTSLTEVSFSFVVSAFDFVDAQRKAYFVAQKFGGVLNCVEVTEEPVSKYPFLWSNKAKSDKETLAEILGG